MSKLFWAFGCLTPILNVHVTLHTPIVKVRSMGENQGVSTKVVTVWGKLISNRAQRVPNMMHAAPKVAQ